VREKIGMQFRNLSLYAQIPNIMSLVDSFCFSFTILEVALFLELLLLVVRKVSSLVAYEKIIKDYLELIELIWYISILYYMLFQ